MSGRGYSGCRQILIEGRLWNLLRFSITFERFWALLTSGILKYSINSSSVINCLQLQTSFFKLSIITYITFSTLAPLVRVTHPHQKQPFYKETQNKISKSGGEGLKSPAVVLIKIRWLNFSCLLQVFIRLLRLVARCRRLLCGYGRFDRKDLC